MADKNLENKIDSLIRAMERTTQPIPVAPVASPVVHTGDHDLLTKLDTKVDQIQSDVTDLKKQNAYYVTQDMHNDVVKLQADHEARIRILETAVTRVMTYGAAGLIILGIAQFLIGKFIN